MKKFLNHPQFFWFILAIPSIPMMIGLTQGADPGRLLHPTGEFSARFMILAMMLTPALQLSKRLKMGTRFVYWLVQRRRALGVAAFGYALLHTVFYILDVELLKDMLAELWTLGIWTGWLAFVIFIPMAVTSNQASVAALGKKWKKIQRWVYAAAVLTLVHWIFVHNNLGPALVHFLPLALLEAYRIGEFLLQRKSKSTQ
ncbi:ferric reductase-like transmembrane domain-containing protein [Granulosicoccus sp.]|nr:ferric reductase-like transmembrane domain-containing protein [Granulosicoccus sp.]MDB4223260.1 ferric reductase-like transmembrane domain-containing protein [Granulosicoccus sp.]